MIKQILCKFGTILTFVWASAVLLSIEIVNQINTALSNDLFRIIFTAVLIWAGFWLSNQCGKTCET